MRCKICDWDPLFPESVVGSGLSLPPVNERNLRFDKFGDSQCDCFSTRVTRNFNNENISSIEILDVDILMKMK